MADETDLETRSTPDRHSGRFYLALHCANALASIAVLKMEGPMYADYLAAGWFAVSALTALVCRRALRSGGMRLVFLAMAIFYAGSAVSVGWLTWTTPPEHTHEGEDTEARATLWGTLRGRTANT